MRPIYNFFGGKSVMFAWTFTVCGLVGFFTGRLTGTQFLSFAGIIHGWVAVRSMMDDHHERKMAELGAPKDDDPGSPPPQS